MERRHSTTVRTCQAAAGATVILLAVASGSAQEIVQVEQGKSTRTISELKQEAQSRADRNAFPMGDLKSEDVRQALARVNSLDADEWARAWSWVADQYVDRARKAEASHDTAAAREHYLMAWSYYNMGRWPTETSPAKLKAYQDALAAFRAWSNYADPPVETVRIPFEGTKGKEIIGYLRLPKGVRPAPLAITVPGVDGRKEANVMREPGYLAAGIGIFTTDLPGSGQSPVTMDVDSERVFSRCLDYLATRPDVDSKRIVFVGSSYSGYWGAKMAYVEKDRLRGTVVHGAPVAEFYTKEWQQEALWTKEFLFDLFAARAGLLGAKTLDEYYALSPRMSLKNQGWIGKPSAPMLLINGQKDSQIPISDLYVLLESGGAPKLAFVIPEGLHMGRSAEWPQPRIFKEITLPWLKSRLGPAE